MTQGAADPLDPFEVCNLEPDQLAERLRWIRREILSEAVGRSPLADGVAIEVRDAPGIRERIDHWIDLESECCGGIQFERRPSRTFDRVRIEVRGVDPEGSLFASLPALPVQGPRTAKGRVGRLLRAGGLGVTASVFFFCVLPMGIVGLLGGTAVAAFFSGLDDPIWIGLGAVVAGGLIWRWSERRLRAGES